jgi:flagellar hook-associated protein 2
MTSSVSSLGSSAITSQIDTVEARLNAPITVLQNQETSDKATISAWGSIQSAVSSLSTSLAAISNLSTINNRAASTSTTGVVTATASNTAAVGQYDLTNVTLAKMQEIYSNTLGSGSAKIGSGSGAQSLTISLKNGKSETISVGSSDMTLNGIAAAINKVSGGVTASVVGTASGDRLVLQGSATGSSQAFSVTGTGALAQFDYAASATGGAMTVAQAATNASMKINGVPVTETSNTVSTAIPGVSLSLVSSGSTTLSVSSSPGGIAGAVDSVATNLNAAIAEIAKETAFVPASSAAASTASSSTAKSGVLLGNYTASDMSTQLLSAVTSAAASGLSSNAIGLTVSSTGTVSFNSATFSTAYAANPTGVSALVSQIYKNLDAATTSALGTTGSNGSINAQTTSANDAVTSITTEVAQITKENNAQLQILVDEYSTAESASTSAQTTQAYLSIFTSTGSSTG